MRSIVMLVVVLTLVCLISALALALVNGLTEERIAEQRRLARLRAVEVALPRDYMECDNDPSQDVAVISEWKEKDGTPKKVCLGKKNGEVVGVAFTSVGEGYGGFITIMMGIDLAGKVIEFPRGVGPDAISGYIQVIFLILKGNYIRNIVEFALPLPLV